MRYLCIALFLMCSLSACATSQPTPSIPNTSTPIAEIAPTETLTPTQTSTPTPVPTEVVDIWEDVDPTGEEIVFWHTYRGPRGDVLDEIITEFNSNNPYSITVAGERIGNLGDLFDATLASLPSDDRPNLVIAYQNHSATYLDFVPGSVVDVSSMVASATWGLGEDPDLIDAFFLADRMYPYAEGQYGFAPNRSMSVLYANESWLTELGYDGLPTSPEAFREAACAARDQNYTVGTTPPIGYALRVEASVLASWVFAFGGDVFSPEALAYTFDSPEAVAAVEFLQALVEDGCATLVTGAFEDQAAFARGQALFTVGTTAGIPFYESAIAEGPGFDWTVAAIPHITPDPVQNVYGPSMSILSANPEADLASWIFVKFYTEATAQQRWAEVSSYYPVRTSAFERMTAYREAHPAYDQAFALQAFTKAEPATPDYEIVRGFAEDALIEIIEGAGVKERLSALNTIANGTLP